MRHPTWTKTAQQSTRGRKKGSVGHFWFAPFWSALLLLILWASLAQASESGPAMQGSSAAPSPASRAPVVQASGTDTPASAELELPAAPEDFSTYDGGWIQMAYHPSLAARVHLLQERADSVRSELQQLLGQTVLNEVHVRVGRTAGEMETLAPKKTKLPEYASGVAFSELGLVLLTSAPRFPGNSHDLAEVFRHELAHIALHDAVSRDRIPRWFNEGFAIHASGEAQTARMQALWTATLADDLIPFDRITRSFPADSTSASIAYAQAADMVRFLLRGGEEHRFLALIRRVSEGQTFNQALLDAYSTDMYSLEKEWRKDVARRYTFWPVLFGGSLIWVGAFGLLIWGYRRRKKRAAVKMERWAREEAFEDAQREWAQALLQRQGRVRVVVTEGHSESAPSTDDANKSRVVLAPLPTIEHDGERHTLH